MIRKIMTIAILLITISNITIAQNVALKTNALYWATTTPNIGAEVKVDKKHTAQVFFGINPWEPSGEKGKSRRHWSLMPEYRYWFCQAFNGWFVGVHAMGGEFNMAAISFPFDILPDLEDHRHEGWYAGGGVTAGYQWPISKHWNFETSIGVGYDYIDYDKFNCGRCGKKTISDHKNYFGITKVAASILYIF